MTKSRHVPSLLLTLALTACNPASFSIIDPPAANGGGSPDNGGAAATGGDSAGGAATGGAAAQGGAGPAPRGGSSPDMAASRGGAGTGGMMAGTPDAATAPPDMRPASPPPTDPCVAAKTCPPGVWTNVTPAGMAPGDLRPAKNSFGPGSIVGDPARPSDLYIGGSASGLWKSTDYGNSWMKINSQIPDVARGVVIAVAGTNPATVWAAGYNSIYKSVDGGKTFTMKAMNMSLYSFKVDPNDSNHLLSGLHEDYGIAESTDGGDTWRLVGGAGFPPNGGSWYPFFIDAGSPAATRKTWFAYAQGGGNAVITRDGGATWTVPSGLSGLNHPHGVAQIYQNGSNIFVPGTGGPGNGVYRSTDLGMTFTRVDSGMAPQAVVWGTPKNVYAMYGWACSGCDLITSFGRTPQPGTTWTNVPTPTAPQKLTIGPASLVVTNDGNHYVFIGLMWDQGIWRYVEP